MTFEILFKINNFDNIQKFIIIFCQFWANFTKIILWQNLEKLAKSIISSKKKEPAVNKKIELLKLIILILIIQKIINY